MEEISGDDEVVDLADISLIAASRLSFPSVVKAAGSYRGTARGSTTTDIDSWLENACRTSRRILFVTVIELTTIIIYARFTIIRTINIHFSHLTINLS